MNENEFSIALGADDGAGIGNVLSKTPRPNPVLRQIVREAERKYLHNETFTRAT